MAEPRSALNLRLVLAAFGAVSCLALAALTYAADLTVLAVVLLVLAAVAVVDLVVVQRRRHQRAAAHRDAGHRHDSLFE